MEFWGFENCGRFVGEAFATNRIGDVPRPPVRIDKVGGGVTQQPPTVGKPGFQSGLNPGQSLQKLSPEQVALLGPALLKILQPGISETLQLGTNNLTGLLGSPVLSGGTQVVNVSELVTQVLTLLVSGGSFSALEHTAEHAAVVTTTHESPTTSQAAPVTAMEHAVALLSAASAPAANTNQESPDISQGHTVVSPEHAELSAVASLLSGMAANVDVEQPSQLLFASPIMAPEVVLRTHLETLLGLTSSSEGSLSVALELVQLAQSVRALSASGELSLVLPLLGQCQDHAEFQQLNTVLARFVGLRPGGHFQVVQQLIEQAPESVQEFSQLVAQVAVSETQPAALVAVSESPLTLFHEASVVPAQVVSTSALVPAAPQAPSKTQSSTRLAAETSLVRRVGVPLAEFLTALPRLGVTGAAAREIRSFVMQLSSSSKQPVSAQQMTHFVTRLLTLPTVQTKPMISMLLKALYDRNPKTRLLLVTLLRELAKKADLKQFAMEHAETLKTLARTRVSVRTPDPRLVAVRGEALALLLDMGQRQGKSHEEMLALLNDVELVPTLHLLLSSDSTENILQGLKLLTQAWSFLEPKVQERFAGQVLGLALEDSDDRVVTGSLGTLLNHYRDLGADVQRKLLKRELYLDLIRANSNRYSRGANHYARAS